MPYLIKRRTTGQFKPPGLPRIDWSHPLANGLLFYGYDMGFGIVDLARSKPQQWSSATRSIQAMSPFGWGSNWTTGSPATARYTPDAQIRLGNPVDFTYACAYYQTASGDQLPFGRLANNGGTPFGGFQFEIDPAGIGNAFVDFRYNLGGASFRWVGTDNTGSNPTSSTAAWKNNTLNQFHSLATPIQIRVSTGNFIAMYADGALAHSFGPGSTIGNVTSGDEIVFSGGRNNSVSQAFAGFVYYGAIWKRALSPSEISQLHFDPYCFLIYPSDWIGKSVGFLTTALTIDSNAWAEIFGGVGRDEAAAVELLGGLQRDESAEVEFLGGLRRDEAVRIEDLAGSQLDGSAEVELLAGLRREEPLQSEESSNIRRDETLPIEEISSALSTFDAVVHPESLANSTLDAQAGGEVLAGDRSDSSAPLELSRAVSAVDAVIRLEGTASVSLDVNTVAEMLSGLRGELPVPLEAGSDISVYDAVAQAEFARTVSAADAVAQAEFIPGVSLDARAGVEITDSIVGDTAPPVELLGPLFAATGDSGLPLDYSGAVLRDAAAPVEFDGAVSMFDALATIEGLADVVRDTAPRDEILSQVDADAPLPVDYQSNVIISAEAVAPFEVLVAALHNAISQLELESAQSTDATLGSEVLAGVRRDVNVLVESLGNFAVTGDVPALIEIFGYAVTDSGSPPNIEILGSVRYDSVVNADWSAYLLVDDRADAEFLVAVNRDAIAQLEIITQQHFASDSNAQMEITVAVSTESTLPTEFISAIVRYDSNTQTEWTALQSLDNQGAANLEFLQNFSAESGVPVEILRTIFLFSGDAGVPLEITFKISTTQQDVGVPLEIMKFARVRRNRNQLYSTLWSGIDDIGGTWN